MWLTSENGKALKKILKKPNDLQLYRNIPQHVQTFASRARIGHIVTNTYLYRFNLTESRMCPLCQVEEEDLEHVLLGCTSINCHRNTLQQGSSTRGPHAALRRVLCGPGRVFHKIQCVMNIEA